MSNQEKDSREYHTIKNPLTLRWYDNEFKVSKPDQDTQDLVSLEYAKSIKAENKRLKAEIQLPLEDAAIDDYIHSRYQHHAKEGLKDSELVADELHLFYNHVQHHLKSLKEENEDLTAMLKMEKEDNESLQQQVEHKNKTLATVYEFIRLMGER